MVHGSLGLQSIEARAFAGRQFGIPVLLRGAMEVDVGEAPLDDGFDYRG